MATMEKRKRVQRCSIDILETNDIASGSDAINLELVNRSGFI